MSRNFWHDQRMSAFTHTPTLVLSMRMTLGEAKAEVFRDNNIHVITLINDEGSLVGTLMVSTFFRDLEYLGPEAALQDAAFEQALEAGADELVVNVVQRFPENNPPQYLAVSDNGIFKGLVASATVLEYIVKNDVRYRQDAGEQVSGVAKQFVSFVAHDLRNPLSIIAAASALLGRMQDRGPDLTTYSDLISRASYQALQISEGLVHLERYAVEERINASEVSVLKFVQELMKENNEIVRHRGQQLVLSECEDKTVMLDPYLVKRALVNIIDNACKFSGPNDRIFIAVQSGRLGDREALEFSVRDEGPGIGGKNTNQVFEPFKQLGSDKQVLGFGLGLTIAKRFAAYHGGMIQVRNMEPRGTMFVFSIPVP